MSQRETPPLIVITGPTASGKTGLALKLAERWGGEIICADSRTVYKHMDIGTAKPTTKEQSRVPHWLLDVVEPGQRFTAADFQRLAFAAIDDIRARGKIPFLVGGSGLYVDSVVLRFSFGPDADAAVRRELESKTVEELQSLLKKQHIALPENLRNKRYLIRSYEKNNNSTSDDANPDIHTHVVALTNDKQDLAQRIERRVKGFFDAGIVKETQHILDTYGADGEAFTGNIYPIVKDVIEGRLTQGEAETLCAARDRQLAKRQITWLKRHDWVRWKSLPEAEQYIDHILRKYRDA
jgi:tRNA dimethylallyltransferase